MSKELWLSEQVKNAKEQHYTCLFVKTTTEKRPIDNTTYECLKGLSSLDFDDQQLIQLNEKSFLLFKNREACRSITSKLVKAMSEKCYGLLLMEAQVIDILTTRAISQCPFTQSNVHGECMIPQSLIIPQKPQSTNVLVKIVGFLHVYNEEFLLPHWIRHHYSMFDSVIIFDYDSTDNTKNIFDQMAPKTWSMIKSRNREFNAIEVDKEIMDYEAKQPFGTWRLALTISEYVFHPHLRQNLSKLPASINVVQCPGVFMCGDNTKPWDNTKPLLEQRSRYCTDEEMCKFAEDNYSRYISRRVNLRYTSGRHSLAKGSPNSHWDRSGFILKCQYIPWPEARQRKIQVITRVPQWALQKGLWARDAQFHDNYVESLTHMTRASLTDIEKTNRHLVFAASWFYPNLPLIFPQQVCI